nr:hypothetical protein CFP56_72071 [Quercus suber]
MENKIRKLVDLPLRQAHSTYQLPVVELQSVPYVVRWLDQRQDKVHGAFWVRSFAWAAAGRAKKPSARVGSWEKAYTPYLYCLGAVLGTMAPVVDSTSGSRVRACSQDLLDKLTIEIMHNHDILDMLAVDGAC